MNDGSCGLCQNWSFTVFQRVRSDQGDVLAQWANAT
jgi:hypothetical protein